MSAPTVLLRGTLAQSPLPELLVRLLDEHVAGTLVLQEPGGAKSAVLIARGAPAKARLARPATYLGDVLVDLGILTAAERRRAGEEAEREGRPLGQLLLHQGLIDDTALYVALREQLNRQILTLCELPRDTAFGLYQANYLNDWGASAEWRVKPLPLVWRALVDKGPADRVAPTIADLGDRKLRMRFEAPVARYRMNKAESALVNVLRAKPQSVSELLNCGVAGDEQVRRIVYGLCETRQLDLGVHLAEPVGLREPPESPQSVAPPPPPSQRVSSIPPSVRRSLLPAGVPSVEDSPGTPTPSAPPAPAKARSGPTRGPEEIAQFRAEIEEREKLEKADYYEVLGVERGVDPATVRAAFFQLAKRWHPDRLPQELEDVRDQVTRLFARMTEAHQVLSDLTQRAQYDKGLAEGTDPEEQEQVLAVLRAASAFQRAEVLMKKRDDAGALKEARAAYEGDPGQAEYAALYAWLESRQRKENFDDLVALLDNAVTSEPDNVRIRWYRGQLYKRLGREVHAIRDFRRITELVPSHVEAQREIRLYEMRRKADSAPQPSQGLFGRWRKK